MSGGFPADCGRKNMRFSTPFRAVLKGKHPWGGSHNLFITIGVSGYKRTP